MRRAAASGDLWSLLGRLWSGPLRLPSHFNVVFPFSFLFFWIRDFFAPCPQMVLRALRRESQKWVQEKSRFRERGEGLPSRGRPRVEGAAHVWPGTGPRCQSPLWPGWWRDLAPVAVAGGGTPLSWLSSPAVGSHGPAPSYQPRKALPGIHGNPLVSLCHQWRD